MGLGGYLASRSDTEHYEKERLREQAEVAEIPGAEIREVQEVFQAYGLQAADIEPIVRAFQNQPKAWVDFMMRFELGLERPDPKRAFVSAYTIALAYIVGGLIPLIPYFVLPSVRSALLWSVVATLVALFIFGFVKGQFTGTAPARSAFQTVVIGGLAASAAFVLARLLSH